jgi:hypothetical protein
MKRNNLDFLDGATCRLYSSPLHIEMGMEGFVKCKVRNGCVQLYASGFYKDKYVKEIQRVTVLEALKHIENYDFSEREQIFEALKTMQVPDIRLGMFYTYDVTEIECSYCNCDLPLAITITHKDGNIIKITQIKYKEYN